MSDFEGKNFNTGFQGLVTTAAIFAGVGGAAIIGYETLRQLRRLPKVEFVRFWKQKRADREGHGGVDGAADPEATAGAGIGTRSKLTCEDWEMGHFYQARMFHATTPSPPLSRWPFGWIKQAIKFSDQFYAEHTGMDTVVYVRFLRACLRWTLLHTLTTAVILLVIHIKYSKGVAATDMSRASLSYLVTVPGPGCDDIGDTSCARLPNEQGRSLLWIHLCLIWYITLTWLYALWWIAKGSLRIRRGLIQQTRDRIIESRRKAAEEKQRLAQAEHEGGQGSHDSVDGSTSPHPKLALGSAQGLPADTSEGWRQRTLMVMNLPPTMRDEASIRRYFEEFLRPDDASILSDSHDGGDARHVDDEDEDEDEEHRSGRANGGGAGRAEGDASLEMGSSEADHSRRGLVSMDHERSSSGRHRSSNAGDAPVGPEPDLNPDRHLKSPVQTVVLVRKMNELSSMLGRRQDVLNQLEAAHIKLAQNVMATVGRRTIKLRRRAKRDAAKTRAEDAADERVSWGHRRGVLGIVTDFFGKLGRRRAAKGEGGGGGSSGNGNSRHAAGDPMPDSEPASGAHTPDQLELDLEKMAPAHLTDEAKAKIDDLARRLARFSPANAGLHGREQPLIGQDGEGKDNEMHETVWEALAEVPREMLDPYQPVTRLSALFRGQTVPTIDYLLTKLNLLTALVTEMRSRPPTSYEPTSTAFVTFRDPRQARMVWRELKSQIVVKVRLAPEVKDLDWERLMRTSFTGDLVRGLGVNVGFWAFTIFWVIIINIITNTLFSVQSLKKVLPGVQQFFDSHKSFEAFLSITLPTVIVSLITMSIPELIFQTSKRAQGFVTFSALYDMCLIRYWKFVICNIVIFFCVGVTTVKAILSQVDESGRILDNIAFSFPTAAPFFVSYMILQLALQSGFEHVGFMIALLQHLGARKAVTPRTRALKTLPRNFNRYYWLPLHINIMAIQFIFAVLNPLVLPFALVYMAVALVVFKKNFAYHYYRRFNEMQGVVYFVRILRYSLDALTVMQAVLLIFFSVTHQGSVYIGMTAVLIPLTVIVKLLATRLWKSQCRAVEDEEAEAVCGIDSRATRWGEKHDRSDYGEAAHDDALDSRSPLDARASGRYPSIVPPPQTGSTFYRAWQRVHDSFNANGMDKMSYLASAHAKGQKVHHPLEVGAKTLAKTPEHLLKRTAAQGKHLTSAAKHHLGLDPLAGGGGGGSNNNSRSSVDRYGPDHSSQRSAPSSRPATGNAPGKKNRTISFNQAEPADETNEQIRHELRVARAVSKRRKGDYGRSRASTLGLTRGNSTKSEERPFLSGYDAVSAHAPVASEDDTELSFADGDAPFLELHEEMARSRSIKRTASRRLAYSHSTLKQRRRGQFPALDAELLHNGLGTPIREVSEFGGSHQTEAAARKMAEANADGERLPKESSLGKALRSDGDVVDDGSEGSYYGDSDEEDEDDDAARPLVCPHAPVRWDDTPSNVARYNNPFYNRELDPYLWLPRDPLAPLDLCDTIEWHGPALVSSQGGPGRVGEWDDDDDDDDDETGDGTDGDGIRFGGEAGDEKLTHLDLLDGHEEIMVSSALARHLEQVEDVDQAPDPAASLPKNLMEDYKRALRRQDASVDGLATTTSQASSDGTFMGGNRRLKHVASGGAGGGGGGGGESFKSPTLSARILADERFAGLEPLDLTASTLRASSSIDTEMASPQTALSDGSQTLPPSISLQIPQRRSSGASTVQRLSPGAVSPMALRRTTSTESRDPLAHTPDEAEDPIARQEVLASEDHSTSTASPMTPRLRAGSSGGAGSRRPGTSDTINSSATTTGGDRRRMAVSHSGVSFAPAEEGAEFGQTLRKPRPSPGHPKRRGSGVYSQGGGPGPGSMASTNANRVVTLRAALKAEALEEERRFTLKEKLTKRGRKSKGGGEAKAGDGDDEGGAAADDGDGAESSAAGLGAGGGSGMHRTGSIMARYEARQRRREKNASEFGLEGNIHESPEDEGAGAGAGVGEYSIAPATQINDASVPSWVRSPRDTGASRFKVAALGALSLARAHTTATGRQSNNAAKGGGGTSSGVGNEAAAAAAAATSQADRLAQARSQWDQRYASGGSELQMKELGKGGGGEAGDTGGDGVAGADDEGDAPTPRPQDQDRAL
ncbi:uncharacterized protein PFL1_03985 [Pseudozyma flocculosa PF-1]|uniref:DUF221-domain-containing protein n=1 Tax=Pseudozyma flocculosa PF-1 TaxID=1277687 RepID=A0A061H712_9BASI|nr:uncharacterized protein PFL1_03985 [Pseudozyma flocculosa PF-1]EPQ28682.1 hypothetical protein PFL1_03985 [Pseudozyma flocculosa PF-1]